MLTLRAPATESVEELSGGLAVAVAPPKVSWTGRAEAEVYARKKQQLVIRHASRHRVVAVIEILSPGN